MSLGIAVLVLQGLAASAQITWVLYQLIRSTRT